MCQGVWHFARTLVISDLAVAQPARRNARLNALEVLPVTIRLGKRGSSAVALEEPNSPWAYSPKTMPSVAAQRSAITSLGMTSPVGLLGEQQITRSAPVSAASHGIASKRLALRPSGRARIRVPVLRTVGKYAP